MVGSSRVCTGKGRPISRLHAVKRKGVEVLLNDDEFAGGQIIRPAAALRRQRRDVSER